MLCLLSCVFLPVATGFPFDFAVLKCILVGTIAVPCNLHCLLFYLVLCVSSSFLSVNGSALWFVVVARGVM